MDDKEILNTLITIALAEDLGTAGDVTSAALIDEDQHGVCTLVARSEGVLSGSEPAGLTVSQVDSDIDIEWHHNDGDVLHPGDVIATLNGRLRSLLTAERTTLNFLQHLSGVASATKRCVDALKEIGSTTVVRDTRKTLPGYRALEKAAVVHGGGQNHRRGLYDAFLVKDNHIAGRDLSVIADRCRSFDPTLPLEIEVDSLDQLRVIVEYKPDIVLLDNFSVEQVYEAIEIAGETPLEISGGVTLDTIADYGRTHVRYIAIGAITHSAPALDIGCDIP